MSWGQRVIRPGHSARQLSKRRCGPKEHCELIKILRLIIGGNMDIMEGTGYHE